MRTAADFLGITIDRIDLDMLAIAGFKDTGCAGFACLFKGHFLHLHIDAFFDRTVDICFNFIKLLTRDFAREVEVKAQAFGGNVGAALLNIR